MSHEDGWGTPRTDFLRPLGFLCADALALAISFFLGYWLADVLRPLLLDSPPDSPAAPFLSGRLLEFGGLGSGLLVWLNYRGHHNVRLPVWTEAGQLLAACMTLLLLDGFFQFAQKAAPSRLWLVQSWVLVIPLIMLFRRVVRRGLDRIGLWRLPTLIVTSVGRGRDVSALLARNASLGYCVVGAMDIAAVQANLPWKNLCDRMGARFIVLALDGRDFAMHRAQLDRLMLEGIPFATAPEMAAVPVARLDWYSFPGQEAVLVIARENLFRPLSRLCKVLFDRIVGAVLFLMALPVFTLFALIIRLDGGPVFYAHRRIGQGGAPFNAYKFRTMCLNADLKLAKLLQENPEARAEWQAQHKLQHDPRITRFGSFLRSFSLDELPQLFNVLCGQMSLVGPRPVTEEEVVRFGEEIHFYHSVRPGLTGLWQVSGRSETEYEDRVRLNTWYVKNWSLGLDILIMLKTIPVVLGRRGAY